MMRIFIVRMKKNASLAIQNAPGEESVVSANVQADLNFCWTHMSVGTFTNDTTQAFQWCYWII